VNSGEFFAEPTRCNPYKIIADNLSKAGWSWGCVSALDLEGRTIWIVDAHRDDGRRFVVQADEKLTAFLELESAICVCGEVAAAVLQRNATAAIVNVARVIPPVHIILSLPRGARKVVDFLQSRAARSRRVKSASSDKPPP